MTARRRSPNRARSGKKSEARPWIDVVVGVLCDGERVLVTKRPEAAHLGGFDEFPGGRREEHETLEQACVRELKEETGIDARVAGLLGVAWHEDPQRRLALSFFRCHCVGATTPSAEAVAQRNARWVARGELAALRFPPANADVVRRLIAGDAAAPTA
jgi:mutator protein MutT